MNKRDLDDYLESMLDETHIEIVTKIIDMIPKKEFFSPTPVKYLKPIDGHIMEIVWYNQPHIFTVLLNEDYTFDWCYEKYDFDNCAREVSLNIDDSNGLFRKYLKKTMRGK